MKVGELQILIGKYINLKPNKFIMTRIGFNGDVYNISVDDLIFKLTKSGVEYFQVHQHNYNIDFFSFRILSIPLKNFLFYSQNFEFQIYFSEHATVKIMKQLIFDRVHHIVTRNIGLEFEITEGFLFDTTIEAVLDKDKIIHVNIFDISGGVGKHLKVSKRELSQQQSLILGEELGQPHKKPY
jgi:hypothetical protein